MRKPFALLVLVACIVAGASWSEARDVNRPLRYLPGSLDGNLVQVRNPADGNLWSAWAYRNGAEYDVAVSFADADGVWSEPALIGLDSGSDQIEPTLAVDAAGTLYLAFTDRGTGAIQLTTLRAGEAQWAPPTVLTNPLLRAQSPALTVVGDRLVLGFRTGREVRLVTLPLVAGANPHGITDGPDPSAAGDGEESDDEGDKGGDGDWIGPFSMPGSGSGDQGEEGD